MQPVRDPSSAGQSLPQHNGEPSPAPEIGLHNASMSSEQCLDEPHETPQEAPRKASQSPTQHLGEPCTAGGRAPGRAGESPEQSLEEPCATPQEALSSISMSPIQHLEETCSAPGRAPGRAGESPQQGLEEPCTTPQEALCSISMSPMQNLEETCSAPGRALRRAWESPQQGLEEPCTTPQEAPCSISMSPMQNLEDTCSAPGRALRRAWESPQQGLEEPCTTPQEAPCSISMSPMQHLGETCTAPGRAPSNTWESPQHGLEEPCTTPQEALSSISMSPMQHLGETCTAPGRAPSNAWESPQHGLEEPCTTPQEALSSISMSPMQYLGETCTTPQEAMSSISMSPTQHLEETSLAPGRALRNTWENFGLLPLLTDLCPKNLGVHRYGRSHRQVLPVPVTSRAKQTSSLPLQRVNGCSNRPNIYQVISWAVYLVLALAIYSIFIPMLPREGKYITYGITGTMLLCHVISYIGCVSINPAEEAVRKKHLCKPPLPNLNRWKQQHTINDLYCSLCEVSVSMTAKHCRECNKCVAGFDHHCRWMNNCIGSRNYWWFFSLMASTVAWLLCEISIILYIFIQHQVDPCVLHMDPRCGDVGSQNTWLLFLPFFHVKATTSVVVIIGAFVLMLDLVLLLFIGQLFFFHLFLLTKKMSTYDFVTWGHKQQTSNASLRNTVGSFQTQVFPQKECGRTPVHRSPEPGRCVRSPSEVLSLDLGGSEVPVLKINKN